ncbi:MAG: class I SAM-dependent DNA methyltransferase [Oscillibacter sp.]
MDSYEALAAAYDELTEDVEYEKRADFVEKLFLRAKRPVKSLLDLACGTGTMTELFARRGYTVTGVDYSPEMLAQAQRSSPRSIPRRCFCASRCRSSSCWKRSTPPFAASTASTI